MPRTQPSRSSRRGAPAGADAQATWVVDHKYTALVTLMVVALLFYMTVPESTFSATADEDLLNPNPLYRFLKIGLLALGISIVMLRYSLAYLTLKNLNRFYLIFLGLVAVSITWSIEPSYTGTRLVALLTTSVVCFAFVLVGWHPRRFQNVLRPILTVLLCASLLYCIFSPDLAQEHGTGLSLEGAWRGLFSQKNAFGQAASFAVILWLHAWFAKEVKWWQCGFGLGIGVTCLMLSRSSTSMFATAFVVLLLFISVRLSTQSSSPRRRYLPFVVGLLVLVILLYSLAALNLVSGLDFLFAPITGLTGKDTTFSGRTAIWELVRDHIARRPLLGSGYGAYWIGPIPTSESYSLIKKIYWYPTESHDGYLDMINDLGYVGLLCLLGYLWSFLRQAIALLKFDQSQAVLYLALLFHQLITNLTETTWLSSSSFDFVVMTFATFAMARAMVEQWLQSHYGEARLQVTPRPLERVRAAPARFR